MAATRSLFGLAVFTALLIAVPVSPAAARDEPRRGAEQAVKNFPDATREEPGLRVTSRQQRRLSQMIEAFNEGNTARAIELAEEVLSNERANAYEKSLAAQVAGNAAGDADDLAASIVYFQRALTENGLDNEGHYAVMQNLAVAQLNHEDLDGAITTLKQLIAETRTRNPEILYSLAVAYFQAERFAEAIEATRALIDVTPEPRESWLRLLQGALLETEQPAEAAKVGERLLAMNPDDKQLIFSQASALLDLEQSDRALALLDGARQRGLLREARDFQIAYSLYFNAEGRERDVIAVIEEGFAKGVLPRDLQALSALAQAAYFSDDMTRAIATYREAAALDPRGDTGLNYAKVLSAEGLDAEARAAARAAIAKGLQRPGEAWMVIARAESQIGTPASTRAALQEAARFPETAEQANRMLRQNR